MLRFVMITRSNSIDLNVWFTKFYNLPYIGDVWKRAMGVTLDGRQRVVNMVILHFQQTRSEYSINKRSLNAYKLAHKISIIAELLWVNTRTQEYR